MKITVDHPNGRVLELEHRYAVILGVSDDSHNIECAVLHDNSDVHTNNDTVNMAAAAMSLVLQVLPNQSHAMRMIACAEVVKRAMSGEVDNQEVSQVKHAKVTKPATKNPKTKKE